MVGTIVSHSDLCAMREENGKSGVSIGWGAWKGVGDGMHVAELSQVHGAIIKEDHIAIRIPVAQRCLEWNVGHCANKGVCVILR